MNATAIDRNNGIRYGNLMLTLSPGSKDSEANITVTSIAIGPTSNTLGGAYLLSPKGLKLKQPATLRITYTDAAMNNSYMSIHVNIKAGLTIAYQDPSYGDIPIETSWDSEQKMLAATITTLPEYPIIVMEKSFATGQTPDYSIPCDQQQVPSKSPAAFRGREYFVNLCYQHNAIESADASQCNMMSNDEAGETLTVNPYNCKAEIFMIIGSVDDCRTIPRSISPDSDYSDYGNVARNKCLMFFARKKQDMSLCPEGESMWRDTCMRDIATMKQDIQFCTSYNFSSAADINRAGCIRDIAIEKKDPQLCAQITNNLIKAACYDELADTLKNPALCEYVIPTYNEQAKAHCIDRAQGLY